METTYEIIPTHRGYEIRKPNGKFWLYVSKVYGGKYEWVTDYIYAKHFSLKTAEKHVKRLKEIGMEDKSMSDLTHLFKVGQKVTYRNNDFDAVKRNIPCIVKETYSDHIIITDTETDTNLWIEEGFNMDCVYPEYNMIGG